MRRLAILGVAALTTLGLVGTSCSSSKNTTTTTSGTGGNAAAGTSSTAGTSATGGTGTAGGAAATGGSPATGTGGSTSAGATGGASAGGGSATGCTSTNTDTAPTSGLIADFAGDAGIEIKGGVSTYGSAAAPTTSISGGALKITENAASAAANQYVGAVLYFNNCVDASAFTGVQFTVSGTVSSGCTVQYSTNYSGADSSDTKGSCTTTNCYSPQLTITSKITSTDAVVQVPFTGTGAPTGGNPSGAINPAQLVGLQWQFTILPGDGGSCAANLTITNISFYH